MNISKTELILFKPKMKKLDIDLKLNLKTARGKGEGEGVNLTPPSTAVVFKKVSFKEKVKPWFFVTFNIILRHIFPENFIDFSQVLRKI